MPKEFHLGDIVAVACKPHLLAISPTGIDGVVELLTYMTGDNNLYTHQIPRFVRECVPVLQGELPWLAEIDTSVVNPENRDSWLAVQISKYGENHLVYPLHPEDHEVIDPIEEIKRMRPQGGVVKFDFDRPSTPDTPLDDPFSLN